MAGLPDAKRLRSDGNAFVLNVGGLHFRTTAETLNSVPSSFFGALASGRHRIQLDEDGSLFLDRNPKHFGLILEYLRNGGHANLVYYSEEELDEIRLEAEYYGLTRLACKCRRFKILDSHFCVALNVQPKRIKKLDCRDWHAQRCCYV